MVASAGVITARVLAVVFLIALIGVAVYFIFFYGRTTPSSDAYENLTRILNSTEQQTFEQNIGGLESGIYYEYAITSSSADFESVYLNYYIDTLIYDTYSDMLVYAGSIASDKSLLNTINENALSYESALATLLQSQKMFNDTYPDGVSNAVESNFRTMVADFVRLENIFHQITNDIFRFVTDNYYNDVNGFLSQKYAQSYALNAQSGLLNSALSERVNTPLYQDSIAMARFYNTCLQNDFTDQSTSTLMGDFVEVVADVNKYDFNEFYMSENKGEYYQNQSGDPEFYSALTIVANGLGLSQRIGG